MWNSPFSLWSSSTSRAGRKREHLAADLGPDASGGTGDEDHPPFQESGDRSTVEPNGLPTKQVMDINVTRLNVHRPLSKASKPGTT